MRYGHSTIDRSALHTEELATVGPRAGSIFTWTMLLKRAYKVDPLECPKRGSVMEIVRGQQLDPYVL